jgi:hypothetical protein
MTPWSTFAQPYFTSSETPKCNANNAVQVPLIFDHEADLYHSFLRGMIMGDEATVLSTFAPPVLQRTRNANGRATSTPRLQQKKKTNNE